MNALVSLTVILGMLMFVFESEVVWKYVERLWEIRKRNKKKQF